MAGFKFNPFILKLDAINDLTSGVIVNGWLVAEPFPIGAIYLNITGVDPATELGYGTWSQIAQGQILVGET